jgi:hypothetical protein
MEAQPAQRRMPTYQVIHFHPTLLVAFRSTTLFSLSSVLPRSTWAD